MTKPKSLILSGLWGQRVEYVWCWDIHRSYIGKANEAFARFDLLKILIGRGRIGDILKVGVESHLDDFNRKVLVHREDAWYQVVPG